MCIKSSIKIIKKDKQAIQNDGIGAKKEKIISTIVDLAGLSQHGKS